MSFRLKNQLPRSEILCGIKNKFLIAQLSITWNLPHEKLIIKSAWPLVSFFCLALPALVYQVLWMKQLGLLFGNTSHAASVTLASFFAGLATGSWFFGRRVSTCKNPMRTYAWLEIGIAATALIYFAILGIFQMVYPLIYQSLGASGWLLLVKFALSLLLVFSSRLLHGRHHPGDGSGHGAQARCLRENFRTDVWHQYLWCRHWCRARWVFICRSG